MVSAEPGAAGAAASPSARLGPSSELDRVRGVGPKRAAALAEHGLRTLQDALFHLPSRYRDWRRVTPLREVRPASVVTVKGTIGGISAGSMPGRRWRRLVAGWLESEGRRLRVIWFNWPAHIQPASLHGREVLAQGRITAAPDSKLEIVHPEIRSLTPAPGIEAVYRLPKEVGQRLFATIVSIALDQAAAQIPSALPDDLAGAAALPDLSQALHEIHQPAPDCDSLELELGRTRGYQRISFEEMFVFQLALATERSRAVRRTGIAFDASAALTAQFVESLPFQPTGSQRRAIEEIAEDMKRPFQMNRILIGDVGSGKTLIALWAMLRAAECGWQSAMMAPTELLAEQHFRTFVTLCGKLGVAATLLTSSAAGPRREAILARIASGATRLVFGTQALIQREVCFKHLGLAVIDEQHRFGVFDRARLKGLGPRADMLLMTATPIPRSLALTLFAHLNVSTLDELPPGRAPVRTEIVSPADAERVHAAIRQEAALGYRTYYVVPLIEGEEDDSPSVTTIARQLAQRDLAGVRIGVLHGRMRPAEKERISRQFRDGALDVLVATTLVEVGIDVPQATIMVVGSAERYGLAQLHQLRGRVGRGARQSRCFLWSSSELEERARTRLAVLVTHNRGEDIAQADLRQRGPGDLFGARQSGPLPLRFAGFIGEVRLIEQARALADELLARDPRLAGAPAARAALARMLELGFSMGDVG